MTRAMKRSSALFLIWFLCVPPGFASWRLNLNPFRERRQDDVASVQVAVQSVAPFDDYVESLQPHFPMDEKTALSEAVPLTRTQGTAGFSALQATLTARGQDITSTKSRETDTDATGTKVTSKDTEAKQPGALSDVAAAPADIARTLAAPLPAGDTVVDPSLKYAAATALMQRVALMSNYVRDAAVKLQTKPYLVRLLVTVSPTAATRGYDAYTTVSFFRSAHDKIEVKSQDNAEVTAKKVVERGIEPKEFANSREFLDKVSASSDARNSSQRWRELEELPGKISAATRELNALKRQRLASANSAEEQELDEEIHAKEGELATKKNGIKDLAWQKAVARLNTAVMIEAAKACEEQPLETIPLLVTDTVSASLHSDSYEQLRDLALALQGMQANARIGAGIRSQNDQLNNTLTHNFNGVMTVSRAASNSIEVRLGAMFGNREDSLVPRTYDVTALVLFPIASHQTSDGVTDLIANDVVPCATAFYTSQTTFRNALNGKAARVTHFASLKDKVIDIEKVADVPSDKLEQTAEILIHQAQAGNYPEFRKAVQKATSGSADSATPSLLWARVVGVVARDSFSRGEFQAPVREVDFFDDDSNGTVFDDGKQSTLTLTGSRNILADRVNGLLTVTQKESAETVADRIKKLTDAKKAVPPGAEKPVLAPPFFLSPSSVSVGPDGRFAKLTFDSLNRLLKKGYEVKTVDGVVGYGKGARDWEREVYTMRWSRSNIPYVAAIETPKESKASRFSISTGARTILSSGGLGSITVAMKRGEVKKDDPNAAIPMLFSVTGADIVSVERLQLIGSDWGSATDGVWKVNLANLVVGTPVTLHGWSGTGKDLVKEDDIPLQVQAMPVARRHDGE